VIRTNEISAKMRPYLDLLNDTYYTTACAMYVDKKYILSFPRRKECIVYDRERGAWTGPWRMPFGISRMIKHTDGTGTERWVLGSANDNNVYTFEPSQNTDNGTAIQKTLRTNKEVFGEWSLLKIVNLFYALFRSVKGQVNVNILAELRNGTTTSIKSFTIEGSAVSGSIFADYGITGFEYGTGLAGIIGILITGLIGYGLVKWVSNSSENQKR
jgi:hypothetical protein